MISLSRLVVVITVMWSTGCAEPAPLPSAIEQLADEYLEAMMEEDALMGTYYAIEGSRHDRLPDNSLAGLAAWQQKEDAWLSRLEGIPAPSRDRQPRLGDLWALKRTARELSGHAPLSR